VEKCSKARQATDENIIWHMRFACGITKATETHITSEYVILIAFPRQQWSGERVSMLRYTCVACNVRFYEVFFKTQNKQEERRQKPSDQSLTAQLNGNYMYHLWIAH
jgi:hypothetical protein